MTITTKENLQRLLRQDRVKNIDIKDTLYFVKGYNRGYVNLTRSGYLKSENDTLDCTLRVRDFIEDVTGYTYTGVRK